MIDSEVIAEVLSLSGGLRANPEHLEKLKQTLAIYNKWIIDQGWAILDTLADHPDVAAEPTGPFLLAANQVAEYSNSLPNAEDRTNTLITLVAMLMLPHIGHSIGPLLPKEDT